MSASESTAADRQLDLRDDGFVTFRLGEQWLGIPVILIQEVLTGEEIQAVPLSPPEVYGFLNLRGQIVTAVDLRTVLGLEGRDREDPFMNVVVRHEGELFSLLVDEVGDVVTVGQASVDPTPSTLDAVWRRCCRGVMRLERGLLVVLDVDLVLGGAQSQTAA